MVQWKRKVCLDVALLQYAEICVIRMVQRSCFNKEIQMIEDSKQPSLPKQSPIQKLNLFMHDGIIRVFRIQQLSEASNRSSKISSYLFYDYTMVPPTMSTRWKRFDITYVTSIWLLGCLLYTSPSPRDGLLSRMPSSA